MVASPNEVETREKCAISKACHGYCYQPNRYMHYFQLTANAALKTIFFLFYPEISCPSF